MSSPDSPKRVIGRRRRSNASGGRRHAHLVKVTPEEAGELARLAEEHHVSVPRLLVEAALSGGGETPTQRRETLAELFAIRRVLANSTNNLNQIARVANEDGRVREDLAATAHELRERMLHIDRALEALAIR